MRKVRHKTVHLATDDQLNAMVDITMDTKNVIVAETTKSMWPKFPTDEIFDEKHEKKES